MANRLLELALEALQARKADIEKEIRALRAGFRSGLSVLRTQEQTYSRKTKPRRKAAATKKRSKSAAARKAQSLKMKQYWAKRRAAAVKAARASKKRQKPE